MSEKKFLKNVHNIKFVQARTFYHYQQFYGRFEHGLNAHVFMVSSSDDCSTLPGSVYVHMAASIDTYRYHLEINLMTSHY